MARIAYAQFPFKHADLDCDYYGTSLHKWLLAPHGTGFLYVRKSKIGKVWPLMAAPVEMTDNIRKFEEIGTHPAANHNAVSDALEFHTAIGVERKAARLRYLRTVWTERLTPPAGRLDPNQLRSPAKLRHRAAVGGGQGAGTFSRPTLGEVPHPDSGDRASAVQGYAESPALRSGLARVLAPVGLSARQCCHNCTT